MATVYIFQNPENCLLITVDFTGCILSLNIPVLKKNKHWEGLHVSSHDPQVGSDEGFSAMTTAYMH